MLSPRAKRNERILDGYDFAVARPAECVGLSMSYKYQDSCDSSETSGAFNYVIACQYILMKKYRVHHMRRRFVLRPDRKTHNCHLANRDKQNVASPTMLLVKMQKKKVPSVLFSCGRTPATEDKKQPQKWSVPYSFQLHLTPTSSSFRCAWQTPRPPSAGLAKHSHLVRNRIVFFCCCCRNRRSSPSWRTR